MRRVLEDPKVGRSAGAAALRLVETEATVPATVQRYLEVIGRVPNAQRCRFNAPSRCQLR